MANTAPPQTPAAQEQSRAVATTDEQSRAVEIAQDVQLVTLAERGTVERYETVVTIPPDYQYAIKKWKPSGESWPNGKPKFVQDGPAKVGLLSDGYEYLNRVVGVQFFEPKMVPNQHGQLQHNPIIQRDYVRLALGALWYNPMGQLVSSTEIVDVDFQAIWMDARANAKSAKPVMDPTTGTIAFDAFGNPAITVSPEDELKALKELTRLRSFGPRYAYTVARTRLLKQATGIRSLPIPDVAAFRVRVVGYRDQMTPSERMAKVNQDAKDLFGREPEVEPLSGGEMAEVHTMAATAGDAAEHGGYDQYDGPDDDVVETVDGPAVAAAAERLDATEVPANAQVICATPLGMGPDGKTTEVCLVVLDAEGKHAGSHKSANYVTPQGQEPE